MAHRDDRPDPNYSTIMNPFQPGDYQEPYEPPNEGFDSFNFAHQQEYYHLEVSRLSFILLCANIKLNIGSRISAGKCLMIWKKTFLIHVICLENAHLC